MDVTALRSELAEIAQAASAGWILTTTVHASIPGDPVPPCIVIGLPDEVLWLQGSYGLTQILLPVWAIGGRPYESKSEAAVMSLVADLITAFRSNPHGDTYASLAIQNVDRFGTTPIGPNEFVAAAVNLLITVRRTAS